MQPAPTSLITEVTDKQRDDALDLLAQSRDRLAATLSGLSEQQWRFKPSPDQWSIAEILEHVVVVEQALHARIVPVLATGPQPTRETGEVDTLVMERLPDRNTKYSAPSFVAPTGRWSEVESITRFSQARRETIAFTSSPAGFRQGTVSHPIFGPLDTYQWVLVIALHAARHAEQIDELKSHSEYPPAAIN